MLELFRAQTLCHAVVVLLAALFFGCPGQDLAPLDPCTVSEASTRVDQAGVSKVDLLFMVDNSGSMANKQLRLAKELPRLVSVLTSGDRKFGTPPDPTDKARLFRPVTSLQLAVVNSSMGGLAVKSDVPNGATSALNDCIGLGSDGRFLNNTDIAVQGVVATRNEFPNATAGQVVLPPDPTCSDFNSAPIYQDYEAGQEPGADQVAKSFGCVSRVGVRGCPFEQQLESAWKALAPSNGKDPALHQFVDGNLGGHGDPDGVNHGFIRDDAILAVVEVTDEEDCAVTPNGRDLNAYTAAAVAKYGPTGDINLRCYSEQPELDGLVWPAERYVKGLLSLKPDNPDRVIFAAIIGVPLDAADQDPATILARPEMQYQRDPVRDATSQPPFNTPSCANPDDPTEVSWPARRIVKVAQGFGDNGVVYSICANDYAPALDKLIERIASKLKGDCLPRQLIPGTDGLVKCHVSELLSQGMSQCDPARGHVGRANPRKVIENGKEVTRLACEISQVAVLDQTVQTGTGWYYNDFTDDLKADCPAGERQRISFTFGDLPSGAGAQIDCFQPVASIDPHVKGIAAVGSRCDTADVCAARSDSASKLICVGTRCQASCTSNPECPPGWVCAPSIGDNTSPKYCQQPTCPSSVQDTSSESPGAHVGT